MKSDALSAVYISSYTSVALAAVLIMGPIIGAYSDRHQNKARVLLGLLVVSSVCILAIHSTSLPLVAALFAAIAVFALQVTDSTVNALLMAVAYRYERGDKTTFLIANRIPPFTGHLSGVVLSGLVINATGSVAASLVVMAALSVLSVAIWAGSTFRGSYAERVASLKGSN